MLRIGIDPSINCTGICIWDTEKNMHIYYMIPSKMTRKMQNFKHPYLYIKPYQKRNPIGKDYSDKERDKFDNIYDICNILKSILNDSHEETEVCMEGVSYGSVGSAALVDLSFLNASLRMVMKELGIKFTIVSPTSLKKFACANGQAEKDVMIDAWKRMDYNMKDIKEIKIDDLADAYFLAHYTYP